jgi:hypothetical protein
MKKTLKIFGAVVVLILGVAAVHYLQFRFDRSDIEHAVQAVRATRPGGPQGATIEEQIGARYGVPAPNIRWFSEIESKARGIVEVRAKVPGSQDELIWRVDLVRFSVSPATPAAEQIGKKP